MFFSEFLLPSSSFLVAKSHSLKTLISVLKSLASNFVFFFHAAKINQTDLFKNKKDQMEAIDIVAAPAVTFAKSCVKVLKRCSLPSMKVLKETATASAIGLAVLGTAGYIFKLVSLPINNVIINGMAH